MNKSIPATLCSLILVGLAGCTSNSAHQDSYSQRVAAAERYAQVTSFEDSWESMVQEVAKVVPEEQRSVFVPFMRRSFRPERLREPIIAIMAQRFSTRELNALASFYGSPEGKSIVKKMPEFMADFLPILQREFLRAKDEFLRDQAGR